MALAKEDGTGDINEGVIAPCFGQKQLNRDFVDQARLLLDQRRSRYAGTLKLRIKRTRK